MNNNCCSYRFVKIIACLFAMLSVSYAWRQPHFLRTFATGPIRGTTHIYSKKKSLSPKPEPEPKPIPLPLILLDVDGVINGKCNKWDKSTVRSCLVDGRQITYSTAVVDQINEWSRSKLAEVQWSAIRGSSTHKELAENLKLDHFDAKPNSHRYGEKWNPFLASIWENRRVIWIDDQIWAHFDEGFCKERHTNTRTMYASMQNLVFNSSSILLIAPDQYEGLVQEDLALVDSFLKKQVTVSDIAKANEKAIGNDFCIDR